MGKRRNGKQQQQTAQVEPQKHFETRKEFVTWLIGVIIWYVISIGCIVWGLQDKERGDIMLITGVIFTLAATGIIIGVFVSELGSILLGAMLVCMCLVLPIISGHYLIIVFGFLIWMSGILIIIDSIAKLTKTTDKKYYKVIF